MKIEIETYKDQTIYYDDEIDKFVCDASIEDKFKTTKRSSLKDVRKEVDQFIKLNLDFKPFKILYKDKYDSVPKIQYITKIRTDGKLVRSDKPEGTYSSHIGAKETGAVYVLDMSIVDALKKMNDEQTALYNKHREARKELMTKLVPMDLSKYDLK